MTRNIAMVNPASASSASKDGTGAATPATSKAPKAISAGAINGTI